MPSRPLGAAGSSVIRDSFTDGRSSFAAAFLAEVVRVGDAAFFAGALVAFLVGKVSLQTLAATFPAVPGFLITAERRRRVELVERVGPNHAGAQLVGDREDPRTLLGPDAGAQAVRSVVGLLHRLGRRAEGEDRQHRPEDLLAGDPVSLGNAGEDRRREPEAALWQVTRWRPGIRALGRADLGQLPDPGQLGR